MTWTSERHSKLEALAASGLLASDIAKQLGISRNAVIGRAHRTGVKLLEQPSALKISVNREEFKAKLSARMLSYWNNPELRVKQAEVMRKMTASPEWRKKNKAAAKKRAEEIWKNPHFPCGHPRTKENTNGARECRQCKNRRNRNLYRRLIASRKAEAAQK